MTKFTTSAIKATPIGTPAIKADKAVKAGMKGMKMKPGYTHVEGGKKVEKKGTSKDKMRMKGGKAMRYMKGSKMKTKEKLMHGDKMKKKGGDMKYQGGAVVGSVAAGLPAAAGKVYPTMGTSTSTQGGYKERASTKSYKHGGDAGCMDCGGKVAKKGIMRYQGGAKIAAKAPIMRPNVNVVNQTLDKERAGIPLSNQGYADISKGMENTSLSGIDRKTAEMLFKGRSNDPGRPKFNAMGLDHAFRAIPGTNKVWVSGSYANAKNTMDALRKNNPGYGAELEFVRDDKYSPRRARPTINPGAIASAPVIAGYKEGGTLKPRPEFKLKKPVKTPVTSDSYASNARMKGHVIGKATKLVGSLTNKKRAKTNQKKAGLRGNMLQTGGAVIKPSGPVKQVQDINGKPAFSAKGYATTAKNAKQAANMFGAGGRIYFNGKLF